MKEYEKKQIITKEKQLFIYNYLINKFESDRIIQINYYYDNDSFYLYKNNKTLRVRQIDDNLKLEYKYNKSYLFDVRICDEYTANLSSLPNTLRAPIKEQNDNEYRKVGVLITERYNFKLDDFTISLDKNLYLGVVDYEIEVESEKLSNELDFINELELDFKQTSVSKYDRFVTQLKKQDDIL